MSPPTLTPSPAVLPPVAPGFRVLVVDDIELNGELLTRILERRGCIVERASNGEQAVEAASPGRFDLILMDWQMPVMDGLEATRRIREAGNQVPIVAVTSNCSPKDRQECFLAGMDDHLEKPLRVPRLVELLSRIGEPRQTN